MSDIYRSPQEVNIHVPLICCMVQAPVPSSQPLTHVLGCACAGTVLKLGTQRHHDQLLERIDSLQATGCFALTELGFGAPYLQSL